MKVTRVHHILRTSKGGVIMDYLYCEPCWEKLDKNRAVSSKDTIKKIEYHIDRCDLCTEIK